ncbi:uroporphyrinogen-III C-methyltransferase [Actinomycetospora sp. NBRC 106378]|uniref:uroporphyrinogen-III C-methyltransferase n=1 Tax=Actinomycetospora sp. NBRC 106378 TaxID=3032208 RepID=UPI0024A4E15B|nr:uroporphyrinogen-III C-methyltransferase [Actinomycetospora sp. NBRC 106378]GLZ52825.1 uroporphyrinogen-III C-methyltransferase [Actinomycetospora sp. NBRC 106378]
MSTLYPVGLDLAGRRVVVVGGGSVAQRRVAGLLEVGADVHVVSPAVTTALEALASSREIAWEQREYATGDLDAAWYCVAATDSAAVNAAVAAEAEGARVFCVRADSAGEGTAVTPAVGRYDDVTVGVIGGGDPRRAAGVRDGVVEALRSGTLADRRHRGDRNPGVTLVGGGPGDAGLITVRGRQALAQADVVVTDRLAPQALLDELPPDVTVIDASKLPRGRYMSQDTINAVLVDEALAGNRVVRLKGGDPFVFGRGYEEIQACAAAGVTVDVVPGVTSAISVPAFAGIPVTHRGITHEFVVVSGHLPPGHEQSLVDWAALGRLTGTVVLLMAVENLPHIAEALVAGGRDPETPAIAIREGGLPGEATVRAPLAKLPSAIVDAGLRPPAVVVIGPVADPSAFPPP